MGIKIKAIIECTFSDYKNGEMIYCSEKFETEMDLRTQLIVEKIPQRLDVIYYPDLPKDWTTNYDNQFYCPIHPYGRSPK